MYRHGFASWSARGAIASRRTVVVPLKSLNQGSTSSRPSPITLHSSSPVAFLRPPHTVEVVFHYYSPILKKLWDMVQ